eukprot:4830278-Amphidinium_carterae.1
MAKPYNNLAILPVADQVTGYSTTLILQSPQKGSVTVASADRHILERFFHSATMCLFANLVVVVTQ